MKPDALIFDLDGTLWDAIDSCVSAWNLVLAEEGHEQRVQRSDFLASMGKNHNQICEIYFTFLPMPEREALIQKCYAKEIPNFKSNPPQPYPGVVEGLKKLSRRYKLAIVSNCQRPYLNAFLEMHEVKELFSYTLCFQDSGLPKGQNILTTTGKMKVKSAQYIGDTDSDRAAAKSANVPFVFAAYGFGQAESFTSSFPSFEAIVEHFS